MFLDQSNAPLSDRLTHLYEAASVLKSSPSFLQGCSEYLSSDVESCVLLADCVGTGVDVAVAEGIGAEVALAEGIGAGVALAEGNGVALTEGAGVGVGVADCLGVAATFTPLLQTNFFPDLMQVYLYPETVVVDFNLVHVAPALTAAVAI